MDDISVSSEHWDHLLTQLEHCATKVPLYRGMIPPVRSRGAREASLEALRHFSPLGKERLRSAFPASLVPEGRSLGEALRSGEVSFVGTSGTTAERVQVLWHQPWWDAQEIDGFHPDPLAWSLVREPGYTEAVLTTPVCTGNLCHVGELPMEERVLDDRVLFLNQTIDPSQWSDSHVNRMADELEKFQPVMLEADPAYLAFFAMRLAQLGRRPFCPRLINLSYEFPSRRHVATIARVFEVPILDAYGSTECGFVYLACGCGQYHLNWNWMHAELTELPEGLGLEDAGILLVTPLKNPWLNLVRFDTGDLVRPAPSRCACVHQDLLPLQSLEGRVRDALLRADGRVLTTRDLDLALASVEGLLHYRLVQNSPTMFDLDLVADERGILDTHRAVEVLESVLLARPNVRRVASVPVEASGKFRLTRALHVDVEARIRGGT